MKKCIFIFYLLMMLLGGCKKDVYMQNNNEKIIISLYPDSLDKKNVLISIFNNSSDSLDLPDEIRCGYEDDIFVNISFELDYLVNNRWENQKERYYSYIFPYPNYYIKLAPYSEREKRTSINLLYILNKKEWYRLRAIFRFKNKKYYSNWIVIKQD